MSSGSAGTLVSDLSGNLTLFKGGGAQGWYTFGTSIDGEGNVIPATQTMQGADIKVPVACTANNWYISTDTGTISIVVSHSIGTLTGGNGASGNLSVPIAANTVISFSLSGTPSAKRATLTINCTIP